MFHSQELDHKCTKVVTQECLGKRWTLSVGLGLLIPDNHMNQMKISKGESTLWGQKVPIAHF